MRAQERNVLRALGIAVIAAPVAFAALVSGVYFYGLSQVPERPTLDAAAPHAPLLDAAIWARFGGQGAPAIEPMTPWTFARLRACRFLAVRFEVAEGRESCLRAHTGVSLAAAVAQQHVRDQNTPLGARLEVGQVATAAWLTRNGTFATITGALAATAVWPHGWRGAEAAARGYFDKPVAALDASEVALLAASLADTTNRSAAADPWGQPEAARAARNVVLEHMARNGAIGADALRTLEARPLGVADLDAAPPTVGVR